VKRPLLGAEVSFCGVCSGDWYVCMMHACRCACGENRA